MNKLCVVALLMVPASAVAQDADQGKVIYDKWCAGCHGDTGAGDGEAAAYMLPRPRDFTGAIYQVRTTASGELPTDDDMRKVIDKGKISIDRNISKGCVPGIIGINLNMFAISCMIRIDYDECIILYG